MRNLFLQIVMLLYAVSATCAENYEILRLNVPSIKIDGKMCRTGDVFSDNSVIEWDKSKKQAIKARNTKTMEIVVFTAPEFGKKKVATVKDYFIKVRRMSTRSMSLVLDDFVEKLENTRFYLVDTISIASPIPIDNSVSYTVSYGVNNEIVTKTLPTRDNHFMIVRSMFETCDTVGDIRLRVILSKSGMTEDYVLTESMKVRILPNFLEE